MNPGVREPWKNPKKYVYVYQKTDKVVWNSVDYIRLKRHDISGILIYFMYTSIEQKNTIIRFRTRKKIVEYG